MLITNHGYAGVVIPSGGAPDTGGQNVYVNALAAALSRLGYRVTIIARGGFPFFGGDRVRSGVEFLSEYVRYVFVPGGGDEFIRKEDIAIALDEEIEWLDAFIQREAEERGVRPWEVYELINTHYWDAAVIGMALAERWRNDRALEIIHDLCDLPEDVLARERAERHTNSIGDAVEYHVGRILISETPEGPPAARVAAAARSWVKQREGPVELPDRVAGYVEEMAAEASPALADLEAAELLGVAILEACTTDDSDPTASLDDVDRHVWTPHSLGVIKDANLRDEPLETRRNLKFCERRNHERAICQGTRSFAATSFKIAERLVTHYDVPPQSIFYFPPCIEERYFQAPEPDRVASAYDYLAEKSGISAEALRKGLIVFETSRMDRTKRKDVLLEAFAKAAADLEDAYLFIGGGPSNEIFSALEELRAANQVLARRACLLGFIPEEHMQPLFAMADVFCTPSEMEGFGMSIAQAAAAGTAAIASHRIPFATRYAAEETIVVEAGNVGAFAEALRGLLTDEDKRRDCGARLAKRALSLDWIRVTNEFLGYLRDAGIPIREGKA
jgi:glycosyltransferase involved in cell wall biosynthesis